MSSLGATHAATPCLRLLEIASRIQCKRRRKRMNRARVYDGHAKLHALRDELRFALAQCINDEIDEGPHPRNIAHIRMDTQAHWLRWLRNRRL